MSLVVTAGFSPSIRHFLKCRLNTSLQVQKEKMNVHQLASKLYEMCTPPDFEKLKASLRDDEHPANGLTARDCFDCKNIIDLVDLLKKKQLITSNNIGVLIKKLQELGLNDLRSKCIDWQREQNSITEAMEANAQRVKTEIQMKQMNLG